MDFWDWMATNIPASTAINGFGLGVLAILFATDRILTKGQHTRRVADIEKGHTLVLAEKDRAYSEMRESRDYYRQARIEERDRAETVTEKLAEVVAENSKTTLRFAEAIQEAKE